MTELYIDGKKIEIDQSIDIAITIGIDSVEEPDKSSASFSKSIQVYATPNNRKALGFTEQLLNPVLWNNENHTAEIVSDGYTVMKGTAVLTEVASEGLKGAYYKFSIIGDEYEWVKRAQGKISDLQSDFGVVYDEAHISNALTNSIINAGVQPPTPNPILPVTENPLIRFIPVDRGGFYKENPDDPEGDLIPRDVLVLEDYYPFVNVAGAIESILSGYTVHCSIWERLKRLYFPGQLIEQEDMDLIEQANTFCAGVYESGVFYAASVDSGYRSGHYFINSVDPACNEEYFDNGVAIVYPVELGDHQYLTYTPKNSIKVSFDLSVNCSLLVPVCYAQAGDVSVNDPGYFDPGLADTVRLKVSDKLEQGFDVLSFVDTTDFEPFGDSINAYYDTVFWMKFNNPSEIDYVFFSSFNFIDQPILNSVFKVYPDKREYVFRLNLRNTPNSAGVLAYIFFKNGESLQLYNNSWASLGTFKYSRISNLLLDVDTVIQSNIVSLTENEPVDIWAFFTTSKDGGAQVEIAEAKLTPNFSPGLSYGSEVTITDVGGETTQMDLISAMRQMFNLSFYTNNLSKEVFIEPKISFYSDVVVDLTDKVDYSQQIIISDAGSEIGSYLELRYKEGNDVIKWYNFSNKADLGAVKVALSNKTRDEGKTVSNGLFAPVITRDIPVVPETGYPAVNVPMLQFVRETEKNLLKDADYSVDMTVVELTQIQKEEYRGDRNPPPFSGYTYYYCNYPNVVFCNAEANLSFSDAYDNPGLKQYYRDNIDIYNEGKRITCYIRFSPREIEAIRYPNELKRDFRAKYKLRINGEDIYCRLEKIMDYDPKKPSTKCQFIRWAEK